jgi:hypothetical protein
MDAALIKVLVLLGMGVVWVVQRIRAAAEQPAPSAMAAPPPLPRRVRPRGRPAAPPAVPPASPAPVDPVVPAVAPLAVTRPARAAVRLDFKGRAALRRAFVAQEVLGPPLALRPPRP